LLHTNSESGRQTYNDPIAERKDKEAEEVTFGTRERPQTTELEQLKMQLELMRATFRRGQNHEHLHGMEKTRMRRKIARLRTKIAAIRGDDDDDDDDDESDDESDVRKRDETLGRAIRHVRFARAKEELFFVKRGVKSYRDYIVEGRLYRLRSELERLKRQRQDHVSRGNVRLMRTSSGRIKCIETKIREAQWCLRELNKKFKQ